MGKRPNDADGNSAPYEKAKLDCSIDSRSMHVIEDKDVAPTKEHRSVAKMLSMSPNLGDCSVPH